MEALLTSLSLLITVIANYFWFSILVITCLCIKQYRVSGLCMLALTAAFGFHAWIIISIMVIQLLALVVEWAMADAKKTNEN